MKLFGFKKSRLGQWWNVVDLALGGITFRQKVTIIAGMVWLVVTGRMVRRSTWRQRIRTCHRCQFYDVAWRKCGRHQEEGCGCFVPFAALFKTSCWGKDNFPDKNIGW